MLLEQYTVAAGDVALPEGSAVLPDGSLAVLELAAGTVRRLFGDGRSEVITRQGGGPNGAQLGSDDAFYICNNGGSDWARGVSVDGTDATGRIERVDLVTGWFGASSPSVAAVTRRKPNDSQ